MSMGYKRIVIKIGSSSLVHEGGKLNLARIDHYLRQMVDLKAGAGGSSLSPPGPSVRVWRSWG